MPCPLIERHTPIKMLVRDIYERDENQKERGEKYSYERETHETGVEQREIGEMLSRERQRWVKTSGCYI